MSDTNQRLANAFRERSDLSKDAEIIRKLGLKMSTIYLAESSRISNITDIIDLHALEQDNHDRRIKLFETLKQMYFAVICSTQLTAKQKEALGERETTSERVQKMLDYIEKLPTEF